MQSNSNSGLATKVEIRAFEYESITVMVSSLII